MARPASPVSPAIPLGALVLALAACGGSEPAGPPPQHALTVARTGAGVGTVTSQPAGIDCGTTCSASFTEGTTVTLLETHAAGHEFAGWSGACTGTGACMVTMDAARTVTATFNPPPTFALTVQLTGAGQGRVTSQPTGIDCGTTCSASYVQGTSVTLTATPVQGMVFGGWGGACTGSGSCVVTMDAAKTVSAAFAPPVMHALTIQVSGDGDGLVTSTPGGINCTGGSSPCQAFYLAGTVVELGAAAGAGATFTGWSQACTGTGACRVTMDGAKTVGAAFDNPNAVSKEIGAAGGDLVSSDGKLKLIFPPGAVASTRTITIESPASPTTAADSATYELGPDGLTFAMPVRVEYTGGVAPTQKGDTVSAGLSVLSTVDNGASELLDSTGVEVDVTAGTVVVTGLLRHFSELTHTAVNVLATVTGVPRQAQVGQRYPVKFRADWLDDGDTHINRMTGSDRSLVFVPTGNSPIAWEMILDRAVGVAEPPSPITYECSRVAFAEFKAHVFVRYADSLHADALAQMTFTREVDCQAAPPGTLETGFFQVPLRQPFRINVLPEDFHGLGGSTALVTFSGVDASGAGRVIVWDPVARRALFDITLGFGGASGTVGVTVPGENGGSGLFSYGLNGFELRTAPFGQTLPSAPNQSRTGLRVEDATPPVPADRISFASRDLGIGEIRYDEGSRQFVIDEDFIPRSSFTGDAITSYEGVLGSNLLFLTRSSSSRLWFYAGGGQHAPGAAGAASHSGPIVVDANLGSFPAGMRCLPPLCVIFPSPASTGTQMTPVFRFDGKNAPVRAPDVALGLRPTHGVLRALDGGNVAALLVGLSGSSPRVAEVEFAPDGSVVRNVGVPIPSGCSGVNGAAYVPDDAGVAAVVSCSTTHGYFVARSALFGP